MTNPELQELLALRAQLRLEHDLAKEKGMTALPTKRKLAAVNKEIANIKSRETKGNLFDTQMDLF